MEDNADDDGEGDAQPERKEIDGGKGAKGEPGPYRACEHTMDEPAKENDAEDRLGELLAAEEESDGGQNPSNPAEAEQPPLPVFPRLSLATPDGCGKLLGRRPATHFRFKGRTGCRTGTGMRPARS